MLHAPCHIYETLLLLLLLLLLRLLSCYQLARHRDAERLIFYRCVFLSFFFRRIISEVTERISAQTWTHIHL